MAESRLPRSGVPPHALRSSLWNRRTRRAS